MEVRRTSSLAFADSLADESIEWIYLDGDHRETPVLADLKALRPKLRVDGLLAGDECERRRAWFGDGVTRAVDRSSPNGFGGEPWLPQRQFLFTKRSNAHQLGRPFVHLRVNPRMEVLRMSQFSKRSSVVDDWKSERGPSVGESTIPRHEGVAPRQGMTCYHDIGGPGGSPQAK